MELCQLSALELGKKIKSKEVGVVEATKAVLENIEKKRTNLSLLCDCVQGRSIDTGRGSTEKN